MLPLSTTSDTDIITLAFHMALSMMTEKFRKYSTSFFGHKLNERAIGPEEGGLPDGQKIRIDEDMTLFQCNIHSKG